MNERLYFPINEDVPYSIARRLSETQTLGKYRAVTFYQWRVLKSWKIYDMRDKSAMRALHSHVRNGKEPVSQIGAQKVDKAGDVH